MDNGENEYIPKISAIYRLFVILDVFSRDSLYKHITDPKYWWCQDEDGIIDFDALKETFRRILNEVPKERRENEFRKRKTFRQYKRYIVDSLGIHPKYSDLVEDDSTICEKSEKMEKTLLYFATSQPIPQQKQERNALKAIIKCLSQEVPSTISYSPLRKLNGEHIVDGPTPLHLIIVKETNSKQEHTYKLEILKHMLEKNNTKDNLSDLNNDNLDDAVSKGHLLRGKTILNIAARTLDIKTVELLLDNGVCFDSCNIYKDNMYHSLVRYAMICPDKEGKVIETMEKIDSFLNGRGRTYQLKSRSESLWRMKNHEHLTPLMLAAKHGRFELFQHIICQKVSWPNRHNRHTIAP